MYGAGTLPGGGGCDIAQGIAWGGGMVPLPGILLRIKVEHGSCLDGWYICMYISLDGWCICIYKHVH